MVFWWDMDADPYATTRPMEIIGTLDNINKAEKLISSIIAEASFLFLFSMCIYLVFWLLFLLEI